MRRMFILAGLMVFAFLVLASISATLAAPRNAPLAQGTQESEPNDDFDQADAANVPGYVTGVVSETDAVDYFVIDSQIDREYQASFVVLDSKGGVQLVMRLYDGNRELVKTSSASSSSASVSWTSYMASHYVRIEAILPNTTTQRIASYRLDVDELASTPTPTHTPKPTSTPVVAGDDDYEPNDHITQTYQLPVATSVTLEDLNFYPPGDEDWFQLWTKAGKWYQVTTSNLLDADTYLEIVRDDTSHSVVGSDDDGAGGYASKFAWQAEYDGVYYIRVRAYGSGVCDLTVEEIEESTPEPTSTPGTAPTNPEADRCDETGLGNYDFDHACVISANVSEKFSFCPPPYGGPDNDFFKVWVKPGLLFECATSDLAPGVDPNMIVYDHNRNAIGGNDDVEPGDYNSYFAYYATYEGWLYLLVGTGDRTPSDVCNSDYVLRCDAYVPGQATPTATPTAAAGQQTPTSTPSSPSATSTPSGPPATPTPAEALTIRPLTTPTPVPVTTPAPRFIPIKLLVYYDGNDDRQPGAGEGIAGISVQAYEAATNQLLAQGFTDEQGNLEFTVASEGPVRVDVPFFGFSQLVAGEGASVYLRVPPQPLPGGGS